MPIVVDAHHHFWQLDEPFNYEWLKSPGMSRIRRDYLPQDLEPLIRSVGVQRTILVQTQHDLAENRWALGLADRHPFIAGVVGWVDLTSPDCERLLLEFKDHPKFVGVRHVTQDEPDDDFIIRDDVLRGLRVLEKHHIPFDLLFYARHLRHAPTLGALLPDLPMVIDLLSKPDIRDRRLDPWRSELRAAARFPNIYCKLSGMVTEADRACWTPADLRPFVHEAIDAFGPHRCMFGSDWPVCELAGSYEQVYQALVEALGPITQAEHADIFGATAVRFYKLDGRA